MPSTKSGVPAQAAKLGGLGVELLRERASQRFAHQPLRIAQRLHRSRRQRIDDGARRGVELGRGHDPVDDAERERLGRAEPLAQQEDLHRLAHADKARQRPRAAAIRRERDLAIRGREIGVVGGDHEIARVHQRQAEAGHRAVHAADDRMRHPVQVLDRGVQASDEAREALRCARRAPRRSGRRRSGCRRPP